MSRELFPSTSGPNCQSTPKPGGLDFSTEHDTSTPGESSLTFRTLEDPDHLVSSEDSGIMLDVSSITEQDVQPCIYNPGRKKPKLGDPQTSSSPVSKVEDLGRRAQVLVERINQSRDQDQEIICSFQDQLLSKVGEVCQEVKEQLFSSYEEQGQRMEEQLQELSQVLERSSQLRSELQEASFTLSAINTALIHTPRP